MQNPASRHRSARSLQQKLSLSSDRLGRFIISRDAGGLVLTCGVLRLPLTPVARDELKTSIPPTCKKSRKVTA